MDSNIAAALVGASVTVAATVLTIVYTRRRDPSPPSSVHALSITPVRGVRWTYRVDEQILPELLHAQISVTWTDITVQSKGYMDKSIRERKRRHDWNILARELAEQPNDPLVVLNATKIRLWTCAGVNVRRIASFSGLHAGGPEWRIPGRCWRHKDSHRRNPQVDFTGCTTRSRLL